MNAHPRNPRPLAIRCGWLFGLALWLIAAPLWAQKVYRSVDANGVVRYTDRPPEDTEQVEVIKLRAQEQRIAHLRIDSVERSKAAMVRNFLSGPIEVELRAEAGSSNLYSEPQLPARLVIPAEAEINAARMRAADPYQSSSFSLSLRAVPGDPSARAEDFDYQLPVGGSGWSISQGFAGQFSHTDVQNRYAVDIAVDEGTPILAARDGIVMQVEDDFEGNGLNREKYATRANHIRVLHSDGSMAVYAHLSPESVVARVGARIRQGQPLGASGNTGYSSGPHLHFAIQINRGMELVSIPFRMRGLNGSVAIPGQASR